MQLLSSVEQLSNASVPAALIVDSGKIFREDATSFPLLFLKVYNICRWVGTIICYPTPWKMIESVEHLSIILAVFPDVGEIETARE